MKTNDMVSVIHKKRSDNIAHEIQAYVIVLQIIKCKPMLLFNKYIRNELMLLPCKLQTDDIVPRNIKCKLAAFSYKYIRYHPMLLSRDI